ncbi:BTB domain-containing protein [Favolaschia claudopus]|uniref:BTB domain-containing protein n=1 Tax=Favolaschia claudopus TaxID=2862362 RepID=A0AAW0AGP9_9AGAR
MSTRPSKRQRTKNVDEPKKHSEIWRPDGNVVLQAEDTQFRVHWSVLALHSSVFSDMQDLPQPADQPTVEGCPVVNLPDEAGDVEILLTVLYSPMFLCKKSLPLSVIGALLRLGRKYDFKDFFDSAVGRLVYEFPSTLELLDKLEFDYTLIDWYEGMIFDVIALAQDNKIMTVLPCAYINAIEYYSTEQLFNGVENQNGTQSRLPLSDSSKCVAAHIKLLNQQFQPGYTFGWVVDWKFARCTDSAKCRELRASVPSMLANNRRRPRLALTLRWDPWKWTDANERLKFCKVCSRHLEASFKAGREKMWEELPGFFDLAPWAELKND